ncbi:MAG: cytochrome c family protein [Pseudomonadota bacterium]
MKYSIVKLVALAASVVLSGCGGGEKTQTESKNSIESQVTETESSTSLLQTEAPDRPAPDTPIIPKEPSPEFASLPSPYSEADFARGRRTFRLCSSCHLAAEGAGHLVGPNLYGLFGRVAGGAEGFAYSKALDSADFVWTPEKLDEWLANPRQFLPGNRMSFAGVRRPDDRAAVIAYLMVETGYTAE